MLKFKRRRRHSLPFCLFLAVAGALLLPAVVAPRANAGSTDYWDSDDLLGLRLRPVPESLSQPQGVLINQPLASNYDPTLALNVALVDQPGAFQPLAVDALFSWTGATSTQWSTPGNWSPAGPPTGTDTAAFNSAFSNQPNLTANATVGELLMTDPVAQNVTLSSNATNISLTINGIAGQGILIDNTNAFTLTISAPLVLGAAQAWTNNSGNLFTVSGSTNLNGVDLTVNGTGNTLISGNITGGGATSTLTKDGTGTLTITGTFSNGGNETINGGTLLMNGNSNNHTWTVNNAGSTLGGTGIVGGPVVVNAGANLAPGNGGNNTAILQTGPLTLASGSNFRIDINGTTAGTGYDQIQMNTGATTITGSNLVVTVGTTLSVGQTFTILNKVSGGAITGTFAGIPQGGTVVGSDGTVFTVSYTGGNGNDIVLTVESVIPEPSTWMGGALAIVGLAFTQRRRLRKLIARRCAVGS